MEEIEGRLEELYKLTMEIWKCCIDKFSKGEALPKTDSMERCIDGTRSALNALKKITE